MFRIELNAVVFPRYARNCASYTPRANFTQVLDDAVRGGGREAS